MSETPSGNIFESSVSVSLFFFRSCPRSCSFSVPVLLVLLLCACSCIYSPRSSSLCLFFSRSSPVLINSFSGLFRFLCVFYGYRHPESITNGTIDIQLITRLVLILMRYYTLNPERWTLFMSGILPYSAFAFLR